MIVREIPQMVVIDARNVHEVLPIAVSHLILHGDERDSRNGKVILTPYPVTTIYRKPLERVLFWPERDANPFFHLYESLWMLNGRNDAGSVARYAKNMINYSDDGKTIHDAYGYRWRKWFEFDQLEPIAEELRVHRDSRRCVLQMWDPTSDLGKNGKAFPCNLCLTFQRDQEGRLDMTLFCRSNDIIWGAYGANAVHFSVLLEYMAIWIGCPVGVFRQISVNWHAYLESFDQVKSLTDGIGSPNPYDGQVQHLPMILPMSTFEHPSATIRRLDDQITEILLQADTHFGLERIRPRNPNPWQEMVLKVLQAHEAWKELPAPERFTQALLELNAAGHAADRPVDWVFAANEWILRRQKIWEEKVKRAN